MLERLSKNELLDLIIEYDKYIQENINENEGFGRDWFPVCINEFYDNEYQELNE